MSGDNGNTSLLQAQAPLGRLEVCLEDSPIKVTSVLGRSHGLCSLPFGLPLLGLAAAKTCG